MSENTTEFGSIEAQTTDEPTETTFSDYGGREQSNRSETETRLETETATEFGVDDRETTNDPDTGSQAEITADSDGQLDLTGEPADKLEWNDDRNESDDTQYLGDVYGPTMKRPIPEAERCRFDHLETPIDERELSGTPICPLDVDCWTVEIETGIHKDDMETTSDIGMTPENQQHWAETGESPAKPDVVDPSDYVDKNASAPTNAVERAENCDHPSTTRRTCTDEYGNEHTKHICDRCNFTVDKHSGTDASYCDHCGIDRGEGIETDGGRSKQANFGEFGDGSSTDSEVSEPREHDSAGNTTHAVADGGEIENEPVAIDPNGWDVSDHAGEEVLLITGITRVTSAPETITGTISSSGKTISASEPHREESTVRLDTETILSGESEYRDSRYFELYTPARMEKNQRSNHAPGPQAGANSVTDPEEAPAPTHWPAIDQPDEVPGTCPNCEESAAPFQVERVKSPRCENCGQTLEEMENDGEDVEDDEDNEEPSAVNMQTWERGGVIETPDASLLITRLSRAAGYDTVLRAEAVDEENREYLLRAPSHNGVLYAERDGEPSAVVFTDELPDYSDDEATYVGVDEDRLRTYIREEYYSEYNDDDDDRDGGISRDGGDGPDDSGNGSSDGQETDDEQADDEEEKPPKILADGGVTGFNRPIGGEPPAGWDIESHDIGSGERVEWVDDREAVVVQSVDGEEFSVDTTGNGWIAINIERQDALEAAHDYMQRVAAARGFLEEYDTGHKIDNDDCTKDKSSSESGGCL